MILHCECCSAASRRPLPASETALCEAASRPLPSNRLHFGAQILHFGRRCLHFGLHFGIHLCSYRFPGPRQNPAEVSVALLHRFLIPTVVTKGCRAGISTASPAARLATTGVATSTPPCDNTWASLFHPQRPQIRYTQKWHASAE